MLKTHSIFVYGTLKTGFGNHERYLKTAKFLGQAQIEGIMFHLGGFPAINLADKYSWIIGEVYQVEWDDILAMDRLESHPDFYTRIETTVYPYRKVWTYILPSTLASKEKWIIPSGIWRGPDSPRVAWGGWDKGALIGAFKTDRENSCILIGSSTSNKEDFSLKKDSTTSTYVLTNLKTNELIGTYRNLGDIIREQTTSRSIISLPNKAAGDIKRQIYNNASAPDGYNPPMRQSVVNSSTTIEVPKEPQVARMLGVKVREA